MTDPLETICNLANCSREDAERVYSETNDVVEAIDRLLVKKPSAAEVYIQSIKKPHEVSPEESIIGPYRAILKEFDEKMITSLNQRGPGGSGGMPVRPAEMVLQNNYSQECQLPSLQSEAQKQETACPSQFECSCDSQLNDQTLPCSGLRCPQSSPTQEKE